jgi:protein-disulfide isomerase
MALATEAAWCAQDQGKFFEYQHALFENQGQMAYTAAGLTELAAVQGLNDASFNECLSSQRHQADVENARRAAANRGINSTPTFIVNDSQRIEGNQPYEAFQAIIDQELAKVQ